ncbi:hypothetical protein [Flavihumibacter solisilvae]|uniref:DUF4595 domain-containing protein n=1 Tax=Flavihumibacter solisilvae TaxID=1349421 RepID=A0A0C1L5V8_9BACT|nr:hypothetical protein [Flavihumibacter solisilvae]KIC94916.1 hypothetical protein OI18_08390 [Flavihumibacter solisilvae]
MKKISMLLLSLTVLVISSCSKDDDAPGGGSNGGSNAKLLKKMIKTEDGVQTTYQFSYDSKKRATSVISTNGKESTKFTYDGDNLVKVEEMDEEFVNVYTYAYANGKPVSGTFKSWQHHAGEPDELIEDDVLTYTVQNGVVTRIHLNMTQSELEADFDLTYTNGNLTRVATAGDNFYTATFTFGNKKPVFPVISPFILDHAGFSLQFAAKNELLSAHYDFTGTEMDRTITNQYTYDDKGYVLTSNDGSAQLKFQYE